MMRDSGFSKALENFILEEVHSLEQLEILLLLAGQPETSWSACSVYEVVKSNEKSVIDRLKQMVQRGFLREDTTYEARFQFAPKTPNVLQVVEELGDAYKNYPLRVVQAIYSKPPDALQEFARAFNLRKDKS
jgi:hypothetical protein